VNIAIIGAGNVGRALAVSSVRAGHTVTISSTEFDDAESVAQATGATPVRSNAEAVRAAQVVVLAVPAPSIATLVADLGDALAGKILVDVTNRPTPNLSTLTGDGRSIAETLQVLVPSVPVIKAFNTLFASRQADPIVDGVQVDGYVAGDNVIAKATVLELVRSLGFRPIDVGPLAFARTLEGMAWLNISLNMNNGWAWQDGWKLVGPTAKAA